jgi:dTDP-4-dehydrorhamnose 3,5-epimerase
MKATPLTIPDVILFEPEVFSDNRGYFLESFNAEKFLGAVKRKVVFVQDNESHSIRAVLRGLHYQVVRPQGKLVRVTYGEVFDVAVDIRRNSPTFGKWVGEKLSSENKKQLWIPEGFAHGFLVLSECAKFEYKVTEYRYPEHERCIRYDDPEIGIQWPIVPFEFPIALPPLLSKKDEAGMSFKAARSLENI